MNTEHQPFEERIRSTLNDSASDLDASTRSALTRLRSEALAQRHAPRAWTLRSWWVPAAAFSLVAVLTLTLVIRTPTDHGATWLAQSEDPAWVMDMLAAEEDQGVESDPAFYVWVEESLAAEGSEHAG